MADIFDLAQSINRQRQQAASGYSSPFENLPLQIGQLIATRDKEDKEIQKEELIESDGYVQRLNTSINRLMIDPISGERKIYDNTVLTKNKSQARQIANELINQSPKSTQYIESSYQRWADSFDNQMKKNSKMTQINDKMNKMIDENGDLDKIESIFKGLQEGDMSLPYINIGRDGRISRNEAFSEIAKITNYLNKNEEFIKANAENPLFASIADNFEDSKIVSSFFSSQLVGLNEASDTPLLTDKERGALEGWAINGDTSELLAMTQDTYAQADKYEKGIETSLTSSLEEYKGLEDIINNQTDPTIITSIENFDASKYKTIEKLNEALKSIKLTYGEGQHTKEISLFDLQAKQDEIVGSIKSLDKEYSRYDRQGKSFSQSAEGVQYRDIFESLEIKSSDEEAEIPIRVKEVPVEEVPVEEVAVEEVGAKEVPKDEKVDVIPENFGNIISNIHEDITKSPESYKIWKQVNRYIPNNIKDQINNKYGVKALSEFKKWNTRLYNAKESQGIDSDKYKKIETAMNKWASSLKERPKHKPKKQVIPKGKRFY